MIRDSVKWHRMADWAERRANEAAESDAPWAMRNLRLWQNKMSEWYGYALAAEREEAKE